MGFEPTTPTLRNFIAGITALPGLPLTCENVTRVYSFALAITWQYPRTYPLPYPRFLKLPKTPIEAIRTDALPYRPRANGAAAPPTQVGVAIMVTWMGFLSFASVVVGIIGATVGVIGVVIEIVTLATMGKK